MGVTYRYLQGRQHTNIQDIYAGHCNTAFNGNNEDYFSFFFYNETLYWPFEQSLRSSKPKSTLRSHISLCTHFIQTNYLFLMRIFWAVRSCMLKETREDYTHLYTQTKLNITVKKKKKKSWANFCSVAADRLFFKCLFETEKWNIFFSSSHPPDAIKFAVVQKLLIVS